MKKEKIIRIAIIVASVIAVLLIIWFSIIYPNNLFKQNEETFDKAGKRYFEVNIRSVPKEEGRVATVSLSTLINQDYLEELKIPYSTKACSIKDSFVKTKIVDGKREYYTYLKCGGYESKGVDHVGPVITLNGETKVTVDRGEAYTDAGVKSIVDAVDGNIDVSKVTVNDEVDVSMVGTYEVTYTASDSLNNQTTVVREVTVAESLSNVVKSDTTATNGYYQGISSSNYLELNNMMFRIVKVNSDDTVTLVSDDPIANIDYSANKGRFAGSSLDEWLNNYFYQLLEKENQELIANTKWCDDVIDSNTPAKTTCDRYSANRKVGVLSVQDYNNSLSEKGSSYLNRLYLSWYSNLTSDNKTWGLTSMQGMKAYSDNLLFNVNPAITLKKSTKVLSGDGTYDAPYIVSDSETVTARRGDKLNTREIGEFLSYSGYLFRITDLESSDNVGTIMDGVLMSDGVEELVGFDDNTSTIYNPKEKGNIGYKINNDYSKSIDTSYLVNREISVNTYNTNVTYKGKKTTEKYKVRLSAPSTFEVFSAKREDSSGLGYWLLESSKDNDLKPFVYEVGSVNMETYGVVFTEQGAKVKVYFDEDTYIKDGSGSIDDPYTLAK